MKSTFKYLSIASMMTLTAAFALTGCPGDESCTTNADCDTGNICDTETNECVLQGDTCEKSADCMTAGEYCIASPDGDDARVCGAAASCGELVVDDRDAFCGDTTAGTFCLSAAEGDGVECRAPANCSEAADGNAFCRAAAGVSGEETFTCDTDGDEPTCVLDEEPTEFQLVMVDDTTTADCSGVNSTGGRDPGSDIMWVRLDDPGAALKGYGKTVTLNVNTANMNTYPTDVLDGSPPDIIADGGMQDGCPTALPEEPSLRDSSVTVLGCTGNVIVEFLNSSSARANIYNGDAVVVGEYAAFCNKSASANASKTGTDTFEVYLCPAVTPGGSDVTDVDCRTDGTKISTSNIGGIKSQSVTGAKEAPSM